MQVIELFAGAGGLALGVSRAGFTPRIVVERDQWCCQTLRENRSLQKSSMQEWPEPFEGDVKLVDFRPFEGVDTLARCANCPSLFPSATLHRAHDDSNQEYVVRGHPRAVRETRPPRSSSKMSEAWHDKRSRRTWATFSSSFNTHR